LVEKKLVMGFISFPIFNSTIPPLIVSNYDEFNLVNFFVNVKHFPSFQGIVMVNALEHPHVYSYLVFLWVGDVAAAWAEKLVTRES